MRRIPTAQFADDEDDRDCNPHHENGDDINGNREFGNEYGGDKGERKFAEDVASAADADTLVTGGDCPDYFQWARVGYF
jgi:hypothetical protein